MPRSMNCRRMYSGNLPNRHQVYLSSSTGPLGPDDWLQLSLWEFLMCPHLLVDSGTLFRSLGSFGDILREIGSWIISHTMDWNSGSLFRSFFLEFFTQFTIQFISNLHQFLPELLYLVLSQIFHPKSSTICCPESVMSFRDPSNLSNCVNCCYRYERRKKKIHWTQKKKWLIVAFSVTLNVPLNGMKLNTYFFF